MQKKKKKKIELFSFIFFSFFFFFDYCSYYRIVIHSKLWYIARSIDKILSYQLTLRIEQRYNYLYYLVLFDLTFTETESFRLYLFSEKSILDLKAKSNLNEIDKRKH